jgi:glycosyltransferase involved in cell wall biosynthesis
MMETDDASEKLFADLDHWYSKLSKKGNWRILLVTQNPVEEFQETDFLERLEQYKNLHAFLTQPYNTVNFKDDYSDIMIKVHVGQRVQTQNIDQIICKNYHYMFHDYDGFIYFDDQPTSEKGSLLPVIGKSYYMSCNNECLSSMDIKHRDELAPLNSSILHYPAGAFLDNRFYEYAPEKNTDYLELLEKYNDEKPFVFIVPSFNNINWYQKNLDSLFSQKYKNFRIIYIDDVSTDGTTAAVESYIKEKDIDHRITFIKNEEHAGALANIYKAIHMCKPEEIIAIVDGDDWLLHDQVLTALNSTYHEEDVWMTYGQFRWWPGNKMGFGQELPYDTIENNQIRNYQWSTTHLRTFYAWLGQQVKKESLLWNDGDFYSMTGDLALMFSIAELAGHNSRFIPDVLYTYNTATPLNDQKKSRNLQIMLENDIRRQPKYKPLVTAPDFAIKTDNATTEDSKKIVIIDRNDTYNNEIHKLIKTGLEQKGYDLEFVKSVNDVRNASLIVVYDIAMKEIVNLTRYPAEKLALFMWQSPTMNPFIYDNQFQKKFAHVYTLDNTLVDNAKHFRLAYPAVTMSALTENAEIADHKKLCTLVWPYKEVTWAEDALYPKLRNAVEYFDQHHQQDFELYGSTWEQFGFTTFKGPVLDPVSMLKNFKFCLCFEDGINSNYVSSKLFEAFAAGCVPVYLGAPNIADYVPTSCFIDLRNFMIKDGEKTTINCDALYHFISTMSKETYDTYQKNIRAFLNHEQMQQYSVEGFVAQFENMVATLIK